MNRFPSSDVWTGAIRKAVALRTAIMKWLMPPRQVKADHPVAVATVAAAVIGGLAAISVALIEGIVEVVTDDDNGNGNGGNGNGGHNGGGTITPGTGGSENKRTVGERDLPPAVRGFIDRDIIMSVSALPPISGEARKVTAAVDYQLDGDIKKAKSSIRMFNLKDNLTLRFDIENAERAEDAPLVFRVDNLTLSTEDVPKTRGHSEIRFTAVQEGRVLWRWSARVDQGELPKIEGPKEISKAVRKQKDLLLIHNLEVPIEYKAPGANRKTTVDIVVDVEGEGTRV